MDDFKSQRVELKPSTTCIRCGVDLFAWDEHCPDCGLEFVDLMKVMHEFKASSIRQLSALLEMAQDEAGG